MATSGSVNTSSYEGRYYQVSWTATQSVVNNQSTISWTLKALGGQSSWYAERTLKVVLAGSIVYSKTDRVERYTGTIASGTKTITHDANGDASFSISIQAAVYVSSVNCTGSKTFTLDNIPRKSTLSVANGTLGTEQTLTVTKKSSSFTHSITATCGSATETLVRNSSSTSIAFTPPISWASQNTTGTSVSVTYKIITYNGSTVVGSNSYTVTCSIPSSVKPSCAVTVTDSTGYEDTYGGFIKGLSKFSVVVTPTISYGSEIASYSTTANGSTYTAASFTTDVLKTSGTLKVTATVKDKRGRTGSASVSQNVLDYSPPIIEKLSVKRCDSDGSENDQGEFVKVTFSGTVTSLNNKNTASYVLKFKKSSDTSYTSVSLADYANTYSVSDASYIFAADSGSSYDVKLEIADDFNTFAKTTSASTAFTIMHWLASGLGIALGKISELTGVFDIGFQTRFVGGILPPVLGPETDLNDIRTPNTYTGENVSSWNYVNCPVTNGTFTLLVESCGEDGQVKQTYASCSKYKPEKYVRFYYQGEWGAWFWASTDEYVLYDDESGSNGTITLNAESGHYRYLEIYFTDNNGKSGGYTKVYNPDGKTVMLNISEAGTNVYSRYTGYKISGLSMVPDTTNASYVRVNASGSVTVSMGTNYIKIVRVIGRA